MLHILETAPPQGGNYTQIIFLVAIIAIFYFFPNYMMHTVYPFRGTDEERRSISFNAFIDEDIYNVYADYIKN